MKGKNLRWIGIGIGAAVAVVVGIVALAPESAQAGEAGEVVVYKSPACGCCGDWVDHLEEAGFEVEVHNTTDMGAVKSEHGVRPELGSCHTALVDGYVVEGHVPAATIKRLLEERPAVVGIAVPGMPVGSPGMEMPGRQPDRYDVMAFDREGRTAVYERH